jgi:hypothetical protein
VTIQGRGREGIPTPQQTLYLLSDPGGDYYDRKDPEGTRRKAVTQLRRLGFHVELSKNIY